MPLPSTTDRQVPPAGKLVFADEAAAALIGPALAMLCDPAGAGWERVKDNGSRAVFRGRIGSREVYVKHYRRRSLLRTILQRLGLADAQREMKFSEYLRRHGVPTARALAAMTGPVEWLCTEAVADAQGLDQWHVVTLAGGPAGARDISQATVRLAEMVGRMHACGVIHCDLHGGNILVRQKDGTIDLVLMDLHRMARRRRLSRRAMSANLAQLFHDRAHFTTRTQRLRFLKHYLRTSGASGSLRGWHLMVEHFAHAHGKRQYANRDRRIAGDDRYFTRVQLPGGWRGLAVLRSKHCLGGSQAARLIFTR